MADSIGIKMANGSLYPVLEESFHGDKKLTLTTVRDDQTEVHIDLYQGAAEQQADSARYIGSLIIENIQPSPKGDAEIAVVLGKSDDGNLNVSASDRLTGEEQSLSVSLTSLGEEDMFEIPDFEFENLEDGDVPEETDQSDDELERDLRGESYPLVEEDRRRQLAEGSRRRSPLMLVLFLVVALGIVAGITYLIFRAINGPGVPDLESESGTVTAVATAVTGSPGDSASGAASDRAAQMQSSPAVSSQGQGALQSTGIEYQVRRGDTLWDISSTYYRNPWLYPRIAKANNIRNPDLIFAGVTIFIPEL